MNNDKGFKFCVVVCELKSDGELSDFIFDGKGYIYVEYHPCRDFEDMKKAHIAIRQKYKASKRYKVMATHLVATDAITTAIGFAEVTRRIENYEDQKQRLQKGGAANDRPI